MFFVVLLASLSAPSAAATLCPALSVPLPDPLPPSLAFLAYPISLGLSLSSCLYLNTSVNPSPDVHLSTTAHTPSGYTPVVAIGDVPSYAIYASPSLPSIASLKAALPSLVDTVGDPMREVILSQLGLALGDFGSIVAGTDDELPSLVPRVLTGDVVVLASTIDFGYLLDAAVFANATLPNEYTTLEVPADTGVPAMVLSVRDALLGPVDTRVSSLIEMIVQGAMLCRDWPIQCARLLETAPGQPHPYPAILRHNEVLWQHRPQTPFGEVSDDVLERLGTEFGLTGLSPAEVDFSLVRGITAGYGTNATGAVYSMVDQISAELCERAEEVPFEGVIAPCDINEYYVRKHLTFDPPLVEQRIEVVKPERPPTRARSAESADAGDGTTSFIVIASLATIIAGLLVVGGVWLYLKRQRFRRSKALRRARASMESEDDDSSVARASDSRIMETASFSSTMSSHIDAAELIGAKNMLKTIMWQFCTLLFPLLISMALVVLYLSDFTIALTRQRLAQVNVAGQGLEALLRQSMGAHSALLATLRSGALAGTLVAESPDMADAVVSLAGAIFAAGVRGSTGWIAARYSPDARATSKESVTFLQGPESGSVYAVHARHSSANDGTLAAIRTQLVADPAGVVARDAEWSEWSTPADKPGDAADWSGFFEMGSTVAKPLNLLQTEDGWSLSGADERYVGVRPLAPTNTTAMGTLVEAVEGSGGELPPVVFSVIIGAAVDTFHTIELTLNPAVLETELALLARETVVPGGTVRAPVFVLMTESGSVLATSEQMGRVVRHADELEGIDPALLAVTPEEQSSSASAFVDSTTENEWFTWQQSAESVPFDARLLMGMQVDLSAEGPGSLLNVMLGMALLVSFMIVVTLILLAYRTLTDSRHMVELELRKEAGVAQERAEALARQSIQALETKNRFISVMSHELRNPLTGVTLNADLLLSTVSLPKTAQEYVRGIDRSAKMMLTIINDVLDVSKIESGRLEFESVEINLREIVDIIAKTVAPAAAKKGVSVGCYVPPDVRTDVLGDATRLRQILHNLCGNATKFTENGEIVLQVEEVAGERVLRSRGAYAVAEGLKLFDVVKDHVRKQRLRHRGGGGGGDADGTGTASSVDASGDASSRDRGGGGDTSAGSTSQSDGTDGATTTTGSLWSGAEGTSSTVGGHRRRLPGAVRAELAKVRYFHFQVIDSGIGIDEAGVKRLFQEFSQVDTSTTRRFGGSGLGLYICKQLIELQGGMIWVESVPGRGSTFQFILPFRPLTEVELAARPRYPLSSVENAKVVVNKPVAGALRGMEGGTLSYSDSSDEEGPVDMQAEADYIRANLHRECFYEGPEEFNPRWRVCIAQSSPVLADLLQRTVETVLAGAKERTSVRVVPNSASMIAFLKDAAQSGCGPEISIVLADEKLVNRKVGKALSDAKERVAGHADEVQVMGGLDTLMPMPRAEEAANKKAGWDFVLVRPILPTTVVDMLCLAAAAGYRRVHGKKAGVKVGTVRFSMLRGDTIRVGSGPGERMVSYSDDSSRRNTLRARSTGFTRSKGGSRGSSRGTSKLGSRQLSRQPSERESRTLRQGQTLRVDKHGGTELGVMPVSPARTDGVILVVDDFDVMRSVVATVVESLGYKAITASDGLEGLNIMKDDRFAILAVFMDCEMPNMDGFQATRMLREHEQHLGIHNPLPVIACTGNAMQADRRKCAEAGMTDFAAKPLKRFVVQQMLDKYALHSTRGTAPPAAKPASLKKTKSRNNKRGRGKTPRGERDRTGAAGRNRPDVAIPRDPGDKGPRADSMRAPPPSLAPPIANPSKRKNHSSGSRVESDTQATP